MLRLLALAAAFTAAASSGEFSVPRQSLDGGAVRATSSNFSVSGTLGQSDAAAIASSANFSVTGGFHRQG